MANAASPETKPDEVGWLFVQQYYTMMNKTPGKLHLFYNKRSSFVHGVEGETVKLAQGQQEIYDKINDLGLKNCKVLVSNVDSQASLEGAILIQVLGEISNDGQESRKFGQTFCLAPQESGYYVYNDIFRFLKEDVESDFEGNDNAHYETAADNKKDIANGAEKATLFSHDVPAPISTPQAAPKSELAPTQVNGQSDVVAEIEKAAEAPVHAPAAAEEVAQSATQTSTAPAEDSSKVPEKLESVEAAATPVEAERAPEPSKSSAPMSWAARAAANSQKAAAAAAPPVVKPVASKAPPASGATDNERRPASSSVDTARSAFLKNISSKMSDDAVRSALSKFGTYKNVEINRQKNCGFVDYNDASSCAAAIKQNKIIINGEAFHVEERRRDIGGKVGPKDRKYDQSKGGNEQRNNGGNNNKGGQQRTQTKGNASKNGPAK